MATSTSSPKLWRKIVNVNMTHAPDPQVSSWPDRVSLLLGGLLWLSSWLALDGGAASTWNAMILGAAIVIVAIAAIVKPAVGLEWINVGFGVWLAIAPWALDFSADTGVAWGSVLAGLFVTCFAAMQIVLLKRPGVSRCSLRRDETSPLKS